MLAARRIGASALLIFSSRSDEQAIWVAATITFLTYNLLNILSIAFSVPLQAH